MSKLLHDQSIVVDAHCDTLSALPEQKRNLGDRAKLGHIDLPRLKTGGVNVQFFAAFIHPKYGEERGIARAMELINIFFAQCAANQQHISLAVSIKEVLQTVKQGKIAAVLAIEGGEALGGKLYMLPIYYRLGVRCMTLTWNGRNSIADGVGERRSKGGLTSFGVKVVQEMNKIGMLIDVSHLAEAGFWDVVAVSEQPIIATHSNCAALCEHPRNLSDKQIKAIAEKGGVIGVTLVPEFIAHHRPTLTKYLDHIEHIANLAGVHHVGIGSDFDGTDTVLCEISDCSGLPKITEGLIKRGFKPSEIAGILGGNFLRVMDEVIG